jgi:hypothetical protein
MTQNELAFFVFFHVFSKILISSENNVFILESFSLNPKLSF